MKLKRYYVETELKENKRFVIDGDEYHHLKDVMRSKVGDKIIVFNGSGEDAICTIEKLDKKNGEATINEIRKNSSEPKINVTLYQAVCKGEKLSLITQKITELGAANMVVFYSKFTDIKDKTSKLDKLEKVSIAASKQCGRSSIIKPEGVVDFEKMVSLAKKHEKVFVLYENEDNNLFFDELQKNAKFKNFGVIIGAEGGFSAEEIDFMKKNNFEIVSLGNRILRTETAAIVSVATLMFALER